MAVTAAFRGSRAKFFEFPVRRCQLLIEPRSTNGTWPVTLASRCYFIDALLGWISSRPKCRGACV